MDLLEPLSITDACEVHRIAGCVPGLRQRLLVSTPETRAVCNRPEIVGVDYTNRMRAGAAAALRALSSVGILEAGAQERLCVLHFLRGGLNFQLREALHEAWGVHRQAGIFLSSQRAEVEGRWTVREDAYRKLNVPADAALYCGDVVATGATLEHGFQVLLGHLEETRTPLRRIVLFTIGCERAETLLAELDGALRALSPSYEGATIVYLEARFALAGPETPLRIALAGTDLLRTGALLAPAFAASQWASLSHPLERCSIYDAGSRAFDIPAYLEDVRGYWRSVAGLAAQGWTLAEALAERWPAWEQAAWTVPGGSRVDSSDALAALAIERLEQLR